MIEQADTTLSEWIEATCPDAEVSLALPGDAPPRKSTVVCYLLAFAAAPPLRPIAGAKAAPLQYSARYLVMALGRDQREEHRLLDALVGAALDRAGFEVDLAGIPAELWVALRLVPRPAFAIQVLLSRARPEPEPRLVRELVLQESPMVSLAGQVLGPRRIPLAGARLEIPSMQLSTCTDPRGRFAFPPIPSRPLPKQLLVFARGRRLEIEPAKLLAAGPAPTITFPITET
jgi:hypothetical protein